MKKNQHRPQRSLLALCALVMALTAIFVAPQTASADKQLTVMTRNLYLGADLGPSIAATSIPALLAANSGIYTTVQQTDFPERAKVLAQEIVTEDVDLVGLQEAALWLSGPIGNPAPATTVEYDFIETLRDELDALGSPYEIVVAQNEADLESPAGSPYFKDYRLIQRDAILIKASNLKDSAGTDKISLSNAQSANFATILPLSTIAGVIPVRRGWTSVDVTHNSQSFRFVNTHLEAFHAGVRNGQALELLAPTGPIGSTAGKVILVGDINSGPNLPVAANGVAWQILLNGGMADVWPLTHPDDPFAPTSGFSQTLDNPNDTLEHQVDHVMTRGDVEVKSATITGNDVNLRTPGGLWPSDHAGLAAVLKP